MTKRSSLIPRITDEDEADIQREIAADPEHPEATTEELATARSFAEAFPDLAEKINRGGRPRIENPRVKVTLRLDPVLLERLRASGEGWQTRVNAILTSHVLGDGSASGSFKAGTKLGTPAAKKVEASAAKTAKSGRARGREPAHHAPRRKKA